MIQKIYESALKFLAPQNLPETYRTALREAIKLAEADYGTIFLEQHGELHRVYSNVPLEHRLEPRKSGFTYKSFQTGRTLVISASVLKRYHPELYKNNVRSLVLIPLAYHKKSIGVISLQARKEKHFSEDHLIAMKVLGSLASLGIQKNQLYNETRMALRTRDLFISMAAHELRTPTTTIQGYMQMIKKKYEKKEDIPFKWVDIIAAETLRLNNLLTELLQVDQIKTEQFQYKWKENSMREIIKRAIATSSMNHPNHKIVFDNKLDGKKDILFSDFDKLLQAVINLINNSVKFSPFHSKISVGLSFEKPHFKIIVKDRGKGISKRDLPHIFEGFYKGRNNTKGGMGLGLFLAENIIQRHRGIISVNSKLGKGTTVEVKLPSK